MMFRSRCFGTVHQVIERLGQRSFYVRDQPWPASAVKLACNMLTAATLQGMGEVFAFLAKVGQRGLRPQPKRTPP